MSKRKFASEEKKKNSRIISQFVQTEEEGPQVIIVIEYWKYNMDYGKWEKLVKVNEVDVHLKLNEVLSEFAKLYFQIEHNTTGSSHVRDGPGGGSCQLMHYDLIYTLRK
jgi:hypothetical protein